ncbi:Der1-like family-domain-containing protein [Kalaharituber pfeilii]|nr:Der1-like family-domain-containing protein [Kalaharituber pfeilii]
MSSPLADFLRETPPISRTVAGLTLSTSLLVWVFGVINPRYVVFYWPYIYRFPPDLWRLVSPFLLTGPKMGIIMDTFFLYRDASECERRFVRTGDFFVFTVFVGAVILLLNHFLIGGGVLISALNLAYAYYWSAKEPANTNVNFFVITFSVRYLPYVMLLMQAITKGTHGAYIALTGLIASHLYIFLTHVYPTYARGSNILVTPNWVHALFEGPRTQGTGVRVGGTSSATTTGRAPQGGAGGVGGIWRQRGAGQRLGGD